MSVAVIEAEYGNVHSLGKCVRIQGRRNPTRSQALESMISLERMTRRSVKWMKRCRALMTDTSGVEYY
jgi:hypothetical protein